MAAKKEASDEEVGERGKMLSTIVEFLARSRENESWGLMVEAAEDYQRTSYKLKHASLPNVKCFSVEEKEIFTKISAALYHKHASLQQLVSVEGLSSGVQKQTIDTKIVHTALESFAKGTLSVSEMENMLKDILPENSVTTGERSCRLASDPEASTEEDNLHAFLHMPEDEFAEAIEEAMERKSGTLLTRRDILPGYSYLNITIKKIELKDPQSYIDPFITVSVKSLVAESIEESQDTPTMIEREPLAVCFDTTVQIQQPLEEIPGGSAIFFEFKHFKPKKRFISTKCFSFMEMDEIKPGRTYLEIYKKPTDYRRRKLSLLSAKALYLHLNLSIEKPQ